MACKVVSSANAFMAPSRLSSSRLKPRMAAACWLRALLTVILAAASSASAAAYAAALALAFKAAAALLKDIAATATNDLTTNNKMTTISNQNGYGDSMG